MIKITDSPLQCFVNLQLDHFFLSASPLSDIDGLGSSAIGGQLIRRASSRSPLSCDKAGSDTVMAGQSLVGIKLLQTLRNVNAGLNEGPVHPFSP